MTKTYVLDTNVLLHDPDAMFHFKENTVIIPIGVVEELDRFKKENNELGRNARQVSRQLDALASTKDASLHLGVATQDGGLISVRYNGNLNSLYKETNVDLHVIHVAQETLKKEKDKPCIIVSRDTNVRIRAMALGLQAEDYETSKVSEDQLDPGHTEIEVSPDIFDLLSEDQPAEATEEISELGPNYYMIAINSVNKKSLLAKTSKDTRMILPLSKIPGKIALRPKNREQTFVMDALLDPEVSLVCVTGLAGCGKTLLAAACGYFQTVTEKYDKLLVARPVVPMGNDLGFLPGTQLEKLDPWMAPIYDAFDVINRNKGSSGRKFVLENDKIGIEALTYIRGRSIHHQFVIIDESQNLTDLEIKTILTRAGEGTKMVLTGDIDQIDNPYLDRHSNGLTITMNAFRYSPLAAHVVMSKGVRSKLSEEAANLL